MSHELKDLVFSLLEDALAMPFNVFSTGQKNKMLKWYELMQKEESQSNHSSDDKSFSDND